MSRNIRGTRSWSLPEADRHRPRKKVGFPPELWEEVGEEAERRGMAIARLLEEAARAHLPVSRALPEKSTEP